jgi:hypothetical protein
VSSQSDPNHKKNLSGAVSAAIDASARDLFQASDIARFVIDTLMLDEDAWPSLRDWIVQEYVTAAAAATMRRKAAGASDDRQGWLALPEFEHVPQLIRVGNRWLDLNRATLDQFRAYCRQFEARIKAYDYPRRAKDQSKFDRQALAQMRRLDRIAAPLMTNAPDMTMGAALAAYESLGGRPIGARKSRAMAGATGRLARKNPEKS